MKKDVGPAAISELRKTEAEIKAMLEQRRNILTTNLNEVIPKSLKKWAEEEPFVVRDLIEFGQASRKYYDSEEHRKAYGFTSLQEFAERFEELQTAWAGIVDIVVSGDGDRMEVYMTPSA